MHQTNASLAADIITGALAGAAGVWVMDRVGWFMYLKEDPAAVRQETKARVDGLDVAHATAKKIAGVIGKRLSPEQPNAAGIAVHYALGIAPGAIYAPLARRFPRMRAGKGLAYGLALYLINDELMAPLIGVASGPTAYPWQAHARGLVSHLVLGVATDVSLNALGVLGTSASTPWPWDSSGLYNAEHHGT